jgi:hypothetical protein
LLTIVYNDCFTSHLQLQSKNFTEQIHAVKKAVEKREHLLGKQFKRRTVVKRTHSGNIAIPPHLQPSNKEQTLSSSSSNNSISSTSNSDEPWHISRNDLAKLLQDQKYQFTPVASVINLLQQQTQSKIKQERLENNTTNQQSQPTSEDSQSSQESKDCAMDEQCDGFNEQATSPHDTNTNRCFITHSMHSIIEFHSFQL